MGYGGYFNFILSAETCFVTEYIVNLENVLCVVLTMCILLCLGKTFCCYLSGPFGS